MASITKRPNGKWRARYRDAEGREHARHFRYKDKPSDPANSAQAWLDHELASLTRDDWIDPAKRNITLAAWCDLWLDGYERHRPSTYRQGKTHVKRIKEHFGTKKLRAVKASDVNAWIVAMQKEGLAASTIYALHARLTQIYADAVHDGYLTKSPTSRRTSPPQGKQRPNLATTEQVWALYEAMPECARKGIPLAAFAGLRVAEAVVFKPEHLDAENHIVNPTIQYPAEPLKTETSQTPIPVPAELTNLLLEGVAEGSTTPFVLGEFGRPITPYRFEAMFREAREKVKGLPEGFRYHDLRHYFASLLIAGGLDIKAVQKRVRHASAKTTLDTYGHMFPDKDESARAVLAGAIRARADSDKTTSAETPADSVRTAA